MAARLEKIESSAAHLEIEISEQTFEEALEQAYRKVVKQVAVPGFRRGRVPRQVLEAQFGKEVLFEDALEIAVPTAYEAAVEELKIDGLAPPDFEIVDLEADKPVKFKAVVAVKPEVKLGSLENLKITVPKTEVTEANVDEQLQEMRERYAQVVEKDGPAELGDNVFIDFIGYIDGVAFDGGEGHDAALKLGSDTFIPGFEEQLLGTVPGSQVEVRVTFPEVYHAEDLADKDAVFQVTVNRIESTELRELDDEFAQEVSECETLAELREDLMERSLESMAAQQKSFRQEQVVAKVLEGAEIELAEGLVKQQVETMMRRFEQSITGQGMSFEDYLRYAGMQMENLQAVMRPDAEKNLRTNFLLEKVANDQGITISEEEIEAEMIKMGESFGMDRETVIERLQGMREELVEEIRLKHALNYLLDQAIVEELEPEEYEAQQAVIAAASELQEIIPEEQE